MSEHTVSPADPTGSARPASSREFPWYDSCWLSAYEQARAILAASRPAFLPEFVEAFRVLQTPPDFRAVTFDRLFDEPTMARIRHATATLATTQLEVHEARTFKRFVVHDHPLFDELQSNVTALVSDAAGEPVEASYNFLSLYGPAGVCPVHLDALEAKWTLDLCIDQNAPWPIHFSRPGPWPRRGEGAWMGRRDWADAIKQDPSNEFTPYSLAPGNAVLFSGSSQWHYRDPMPQAGGRRFCDLLFFHFIPRGTAELVKPGSWSRLFNAPELDGIGDGL